MSLKQWIKTVYKICYLLVPKDERNYDLSYKASSFSWQRSSNRQNGSIIVAAPINQGLQMGNCSDWEGQNRTYCHDCVPHLREWRSQTQQLRQHYGFQWLWNNMKEHKAYRPSEAVKKSRGQTQRINPNDVHLKKKPVKPSSLLNKRNMKYLTPEQQNVRLKTGERESYPCFFLKPCLNQSLF